MLFCLLFFTDYYIEFLVASLDRFYFVTGWLPWWEGMEEVAAQYYIILRDW